MKLPRLNKYSTAAMLFLAAAVVFVAIALITNLGEFITAAFVISGAILAMTGIFILTFSRGEPFDAQLVGLLPAQGSINLCRIGTDLEILGKAHFLPGSITGKNRVLQFNPASGYNGSQVSGESSFPKTGPEGLVTTPSGEPLIQILKKRNKLSIADNEDNVPQLLHEIIEEILEFAPRVSVQRDDGRFTITMHQYRLIDGCRFIAQQSKDCCVRNPCPVCSLCGAVIAEGTNQVVTLEQCFVSSSDKDVIITWSIMSPP